ncbi:LytR/AlgR family response regulator transcription factor [Aminipila terrae]|uniref:Stage 0 sporulation protein A homolog n=1 Tax=Aminipila terrae TaxID=2697030 RepID=A0A6P1MLR9_9FIRM|nr:LytTR family DNA-binding domain-containing protein [Aminipila terrae]QHI73018.1 response regulator [Aminipila terrae]
MKIAVCDDEPLFRENIKNFLDKYYNSLDVGIYTFSNGQQLIEQIRKNEELFQIIFLDIEMPGTDGFESAKIIHDINKNIPIIFLTSHTELAMEGYEVNAFRFLSKPVDEDKLKKALNDIESFLENDEKIMVCDSGTEYVLYVRDIMYIQAENVYINLFTAKGSYLIRKKINEMETLLNKLIFFRSHRSYIVNMEFIESFDGKKIIMKDKKEIPISKKQQNEFKYRMMDYLRKNSK